MTQVLAPGRLRYADPYWAPAQAASADSYALQRIWAEVLNQWRLPVTHQAQGNATASAMTRAANNGLAEIPSQLQEPARQLLGRLTEALVELLPAVNPLAELWPIRLAALDDQSALLEWIRLDRRLGFVLSSVEGETGWFFVYSAGSSERYEAGTMDQLELNRMTRLMLK